MRKILAALLLAALSFTASAEVWQARYGVAETFNFKLFNADGTLDVDEADGGTEVSLSCNEGAQTTATNDFVDEGDFYSIALTAAELQCERIAVVVAATTTEVFFVQTSGNASAMTPTYEANVASATTGAIENQDFATTPGASGGLLIAGTNADFDVTANVGLAGGLSITQSSANTAALVVTGNGTGNGATFTSGSGATGNGVSAVAASTNGHGFATTGAGTGSGQISTGGATGHGFRLVGGSTSGNGISTSFTAPSTGAVELGFGVSGTLSGTHSSTTADLGTNAPGTVSDIVGHLIWFPTRNASRLVSAYDTSTGVATWATALDADITLANADPWLLYATPPGSGSTDVNVITVEGSDATTYLETLDNPTLARLPAALVSGRMDASVGAYQTGLTPLQPTVALRTLDVSATGEAGLDLANVGSPTTTLALSGTTISTAQVAASVTGNVGGNVIGFVGSVNTNGISAASIAPDAGTELGTAIWAATTRELTSGLNIVLAKGTGLTGLNDLSAVQVNAEADAAIETYHLNRLFSAAYDPASKPGDAAGLLNVIVENDAGVPRFTTNVLENGPAGGGGGSSDWSVGEREQIRHRIGIDGAATAPSATPSLASAAQIAALNDPTVAEIWSYLIEDQGGGIDARCAMALLSAFAFGDISTSGQTTTWRDPSNGEVRIVSVVTSNGNRTATPTCPTY